MVQGKIDWIPTYLEKTENNGDRFWGKGRGLRKRIQGIPPNSDLDVLVECLKIGSER